MKILIIFTLTTISILFSVIPSKSQTNFETNDSIKYFENKYQESKSIILNLISQKERIFGTKHIEYLKSIKQLAEFYIINNNTTEALTTLIKCDSLMFKISDTITYEKITLMDSLAKLYRRINYPDKEENIYNRLIKLLDTSSKYQIEYANVLSKLASIYESKNDKEKAILYYKEANKIILEKLDTYKAKEGMTSKDKKKIKGGKDYALLIACDKYDYAGSLNNPINDARIISSELKNSFNFEIESVENPVSAMIYSKLRKYCWYDYQDEDQLFIYFAGHGHYDNMTKEGFIVAKDSKIDDETLMTLIPHSRLHNIINNIPCKHIFLIIDACFSGTFDPNIKHAYRGIYDEASSEELVIRKLKFKTRRYLTSGGKVYVSDGMPGQSSPFSRKLIEAFRSQGGDDGILTLSELMFFIEKVKPEPQFNEFGDNEPGSDFIFISR